MQTKLISMSWVAVAEAFENNGDKRDVTRYFQYGIYRSVPVWSHSQNSVAAAGEYILNIFSNVL